MLNVGLVDGAVVVCAYCNFDVFVNWFVVLFVKKPNLKVGVKFLFLNEN